MEQKIEYLTNEYIIDWLSKNCLPQSEIDELNRVANEAASKANDSVSDEMIENNEEISEEEMSTLLSLMIDMMGYGEEEEREVENKNETSDNFDESLSEIIDGLRLLQKYGHIM